MKVALYVVAILLAGGAAYFSFEVSSKLEDQVTQRETATTTNESVSASLDAKRKELSDEKAALELAEKEKAEVDQRIAALQSNQGPLKRELAELEGQLEEQQVAFDQAQKALAEATSILKDLGDVTLENLPEKIAAIEEDRKSRRAKLADLESLVATAQTQLETNRSESARLTERRTERSARISRNAMEAVVTAVDQDWGFVVIGAGSNSGFTPQTTLLVRRQGRLIGRVRPSSIEPTQTIADIIPGSVARGVRIQPGDRVILAKPQN